jgi:uncharacterized membrane protein HdeD (DUF308 family)
MLVLRGVLAVLFGIAAFVWPEITLEALVILFGAFSLVEGVFNVASALMQREGYWGLLLLEGVFGVLIGILTFAWPGITALVLLYLIAGWAIVTGVFEIFAAVQLRKQIEGEWLLGLGGLLSIIFGVLMALQPGSGALALVWLIGGYAVVFGVILIALGLRLRNVKSFSETQQTFA